MYFIKSSSSIITTQKHIPKLLFLRKYKIINNTSNNTTDN